ncbi:MAG: HAD family phosphatase [Candidatus Aenigmarchaeota archaeon]|nr:HAD family phosphatase [Candidatus Aenigmarchaeota archaeon]
MFLEAARQLEIKPEECVVIEDAGNGIEAAKNANMKAVGLVTKYHSANELKEADIAIKDFSELNIDRVRNLF